MIAVDTNVLVAAHRVDAPLHEAARVAVKGLAEGVAAWALPWPVISEFLGVTTHPRVFDPPSTSEQAVSQMDAWLSSPSVVLLSERASAWRGLRELVLRGQSSGPRVHDARVAALCLDHGVTVLWSADRDFSRFPQLRVYNPLVGAPSG